MRSSSPNGGAVLPMVEAQPEAAKKIGLPTWAHVMNWIVFSNITIVFNKWLIDTAGFKYPILLTCWHLVFATVATQILARTTSLLDSRHSLPVTGRLYLRTILPIGVLYSGSLVCSNVVYLHLSVAFIQMLKAAAPVAVLFASWAWRVSDPSLPQLLNILVIVLGVAVASAGEIHFSWVGFLFQLGGTVFEAVRIVMIQVLLSGEGLKMDPLVGLYYYAPVCAVMNVLIACVSELPRFRWEDLARAGPGVLFLNALVAFILNVISVCLIGKTSGLVMTLTGIFKNILLLVASVFIWHTHIGLLQALGYTVALAGLVYYSLGYDQLVSLYHSSIAYVFDSPSSPSSSSDRRRASIVTRRGLLIGLFLLLTIIVLIQLAFNNSTQARNKIIKSMTN